MERSAILIGCPQSICISQATSALCTARGSCRHAGSGRSVHSLFQRKSAPLAAPGPNPQLPPRRTALRTRAEKEDPQSSSSSSSSQGKAGLKKDEAEKRPPPSTNGTGEHVKQAKGEAIDSDWKNDPDFKRIMGDRSIEAVLMLEKKITEQKLSQLEAQRSSGEAQNLFQRFLRRVTESNLRRQKRRLESVEGAFRALDLNKLRNAFGIDTFFPRDARRFGDGGIFVGSFRAPIEALRQRLNPRLREAAGGREVDVWYLQEDTGAVQRDVIVVQPKDEIDLQFEGGSLSNASGAVIAALLSTATLASTLIMSGFFQPLDQTVPQFISREAELFAGFIAILVVSEVATRWAASWHGVKISPTILIPSTYVGSLGAINNVESLLPNRTALFDIAAARSASALLTSAILVALAFISDGGSFNGGANALYIPPQFFFNNPLLSFIQYITGPYTDELGNVLPQAVEGLGVPVDPLALAGLLGMVVTSLNLLPAGRLDGGRIVQALYGRRVAAMTTTAVIVGLGLGGIFGSSIALVWALITTFLRGGEEVPALDEVTSVSQERYILSFVLGAICILALFPNSAGTFPSPLYTPPFFRGELM